MSSIRTPSWPACPPGPVVVLVDASSRLEERLLGEWITTQMPPGADVTTIHIASSRRRRHAPKPESRFARALRQHPGQCVFAVRIAWMPPLRKGTRTARWTDLLKLGDPRDPFVFRQHLMHWLFPERHAIVVSDTAKSASMIRDHENSIEAAGLADFVNVRAWRALERAERRLRGNRYKVPKFVREDIFASVSFRKGLARVAAEDGLAFRVAWRRSIRYLREIAATHHPFVIDLMANAIQWIYKQGYASMRYDPERLASVTSASSELPIAFLPAHRSNLDRLALQFVLWENDLPSNHTAGGINMNFFPVGPILRRSGIFFIRRSFKDNQIYRYVLASYLDYLIEKRFTLEWYIEGGRSRSGKLLPPKYGLLSYSVDSIRRNKADDMNLIPVSIVYDQLQDVASYATESRGGEKHRENATWAFRAIRSLRRRYGNIHLRFGDPISVAKELDLSSSDETDIDLQKLAFEVMYRIGEITPITSSSVASIALLQAGGEGRTASELAAVSGDLESHIEARGFPTTEAMNLHQVAALETVLDRMVEHGSVSREGTAGNRVYWLNAEQQLHASYYRNTIVHFFVDRAVGELALAASTDVESFWEAVEDIRDVLKFEFYFPTRAEFEARIETDLAIIDDDWQTKVAAGKGSDVLAAMSWKAAGFTVLPFLEAYVIVGDELEDLQGPFDRSRFLADALQRGRIYAVRGEVSYQAASKPLMEPALQLAENRGVVDDRTRRAEFAWALREVRSLAKRNR